MYLLATGLNKTYQVGTERLHVLRGLDLAVEQGEMVAVVGASGVGKSTLLHLLGGLDRMDSGSVSVGDRNISQLSDAELVSFRNTHIGFVFQFHHLLPEFNALENVCIPGWIAGRKKKEVTESATRLLDTLHLKDRMENKPQQLSGGEQQRVAIARALINNPQIIFADEPTGNLDSKNAKELHELFIQLKDEFNQTFLIVTHNEELAALSDRTIHMKDGRIVEQSTENTTV